MRKIRQLLLCLLVTVLHLAGTVLPVQAKNPDGSGKSRLIYVVYDDSQSMVDSIGNPDNPGNMLKRWSQARYAMEVFAAMMEEDDEMRVFPMSLRGQSNLTLKGKDSKRVESLHKWNSQYGGTPWDSITNAAEDLKKQTGAGFDERWLIILTDGAVRAGDGSGWNPDIDGNVVQSTLEGYARDGIKVSYIAIGTNPNNLQSKENIGLYVSITEDNAASVIAKVTDTANKIFTRMELPSAYIKSSGTKKTLDIDIPTDRIIIFAQGKDAKIESLTYNGQQIKADNTYPVKYSDVTPGGYEAYEDKIERDRSLTGVVAEFVAKGQPFSACTPDRKYEAVISGANDADIKYYYTPGARITFLVDGKKVSIEDTELDAGDHEIKMVFIDPVSGNVVESELLDGAKMTMIITAGGETQTIENGTGHITIEDGDMDVEVSAVWEQYGNIRMDQKKHYRVRPEPIKLKIDVLDNPGSWSPDYLVNNADPVIIRITNEAGEALTDQQIDAMEISVDCASQTGIKWTVTKGDEKGTWKLTPSSSDGTLSGITPGANTWNIHGEFHIDMLDAAGNAQMTVKVIEYTSSRLLLTAENSGTFELMHAKRGYVTVTAKYEDTSVGQMKPLTEEMWKRLRLKVETQLNGEKKNLGWKVKLGDETGTYKVTMDPLFYLIRWPFNAHGDLTLHMEGSVTEGEYLYSGTLDHPVHVEGMDLWVILLILLILLAVIVYIIGMWIKPKIPRSKTGETVHYNTRDGDEADATKVEAKIKRDFWSVITPYVPEKAEVESNKGSWNRCPKLQIQALPGGEFCVINKPSTVGQRIKSDEILWPEIDKDQLVGEDAAKHLAGLKDHHYGYGSFEVITLPPQPLPGQGRRSRSTMDVGKFHFVNKSEIRRYRRQKSGGFSFHLPELPFGNSKKSKKKPKAKTGNKKPVSRTSNKKKKKPNKKY